MQDYLLTALTPSIEDARNRVESIFADLESQAIDYFLIAGHDRGQIELVRSLDMRYNGQEHTVRVRVPEGELEFDALNDRFHAAHEKAYTSRLPSGVEIVNYHVAAVVPTAKPALAELEDEYSGKLRVIEGDALEIDERSEIGDGAHIVANLPYNVGTALLLRWLGGESWPPWWSSLTLMFQREVAERLHLPFGLRAVRGALHHPGLVSHHPRTRVVG